MAGAVDAVELFGPIEHDEEGVWGGEGEGGEGGRWGWSLELGTIGRDRGHCRG